MRKESDGFYYEKEVTWKRNKEKTPALCISALFFGLTIGYLIRHYAPDPNLIGTILISFIVSFGLLIIHLFLIHDRKVKLKRIGK